MGAISEALDLDGGWRRLELVRDPGARSGAPRRGDALTAHEGDAAPEGDGRHRPRVLVVDDEPSMRLLLRVNLGMAGFDVVDAADGAAALECAAAADFDLVLLDVMMPDLSGYDVARALRDDPRTAAFPVVFVSARAAADDLRTGYELGAADYITKPFDPLEVAERLTDVLETVRAGKADDVRRARLEELGGSGGG